MPDFKSLDDRKVAKSTKIYDRTGEIVLYDIHQDIKRTIIPIEEMGSNITRATVAIEDSDFYYHKGIKPISIIRAILVNILHGEFSQGGSTITQQVIKNSLLTKEKTLTRKLKEWILALRIEKTLSKDEILALYLNDAPYGGSVYGIAEASRVFFSKDPIDLTLAESAYLAAIPQAPTFYSPHGKNKIKLDERKNLVLSRMKDLGVISLDEYTSAKNEVVSFQNEEPVGIQAPHFVFFIREYLEQKYGNETLLSGGLKVITTLDYDLQKKAEEIVAAQAPLNEKNFGGKNAALVAIDPKTGQILSMVGSRNYFDKDIEGNFNVATANRQPGSSFKPFIYVKAFEKGYTPDTVLFDVPTEFQSTCTAYGRALPGKKQEDCYMPDNYDNAFRGPMTLRNALAQSINIPAIKLLYLVGVPDAIKLAREMGIQSLRDASFYGLTLVIGGGEVTLLDMTSAYGVFATNGIRNPYQGILSIEDATGNILEEYRSNPRRVISENSTKILSDILSDNTARTPTFGAHSALVVPGYDVAVKTGTTNNNKDAWIIGYSPTLVVGVWAGNNDNTPMKKGGAALAGPIWHDFMVFSLPKFINERFEEPILSYDTKTIKPVLRGLWQGGESFLIDTISKKLATEFTPPETIEEKVITNVHSILYWVDKTNPVGPPLENPENDSQFNRWETAVLNWWQQNKNNYPIVTKEQLPIEYDNIHTENSKLDLVILSPDTNEPLDLYQSISLQVKNSKNSLVKKINVFLNDRYIGSSNQTNPDVFTFIPSDTGYLEEGGLNTIRIVGYDAVYNVGEVEFDVITE
jgi:1A family penicillin-binding protein